MSIKQSIQVFLWSALMAWGTPSVLADDEFDEFIKSATQELEEFEKTAEKELDDFRRQANDEMTEFLGRPWKEFRRKKPVVAPPDPSPAPIVIDDNTPLHDPRPIVIDEVITPPSPQPQPQPISPIKERPVTVTVPDLKIRMYGTDFHVRDPRLTAFKINSSSGLSFANAWSYLNTDKTDNLIVDCLNLRDNYNLCDWAYLQLLQKVAARIADNKSNETALLTGFLFAQSGYKMRYALDDAGILHMMYATRGIVYDKPCFTIEGESYYPLTQLNSRSAQICNFSFPKEQFLDFGIHKHMKFNSVASSSRHVEAKFVPQLVVDLSVNKNMIDFFNDYPEATLDRSPYTKWAIYANTPASPEVVNNLYPAVRKCISGKNQHDAANILLHLAQSFPYGYDDKIWGRDRAFFMDESWYYPEIDCEDHAIHFSRLVRDLMGLDVALVYYPGHLASAVAFTDPSVQGDYIIHNGRKYIVCDPTIFYSGVGQTMSGMDNAGAVLIDLLK